MKIILLAGGLVCIALLGAAAIRRAVTGPKSGTRSERPSIMEAQPERMSLFSADHVRMLSESQLQAIECEDEDLS